jgi:hypothetical protein
MTISAVEAVYAATSDDRRGSIIVPPNGTDDTAAIQAALTNAPTLLAPGAYTVSSPLQIPTGGALIGAGRDKTTIKLAAGANSDVATTAGYGTTGAGTFAIRELAIDGNKAQNPTGGCGLKLDGYSYVIDNVDIGNTHGDAFYTQMSANPTDMEAFIRNLKVHDSDAAGFHFTGPHDSHISNLVAYQNATKGIWITSTCQINTCHSWGNNQTHGFYIEAGCVITNYEAEGAQTGQVMVGAHDVLLFGGNVFSAGTDGKVGFLMGDATHTSLTGSMIFSKVQGCTNGSFVFQQADVGQVRVMALVSQASGNVVTGGPFSTATIDILLQGAGTMNLGTNPLTPVQTRPLVAATTPGSVTGKLQVFDQKGASLGFLPVYGSIA